MATAVGRARTEDEITAGLMAMVAWGGNASAASRSLKAEKGIEIASSTLLNWAKETHAARYDELREKYHEQLEAQLVHEFRDVARHAVEVQRLALSRALERLEGEKDQDPGRTAANAAAVAKAMTDKMLSLSGRPTSIREDRNVDEIVRNLMARGVLTLPEGAVQELPAPKEPGDGE